MSIAAPGFVDENDRSRIAWQETTDVEFRKYDRLHKAHQLIMALAAIASQSSDSHKYRVCDNIIRKIIAPQVDGPQSHFLDVDFDLSLIHI